MKRKICACVMAAAMVTALVGIDSIQQPRIALAQGVYLGDVNSDSIIDSSDASMILAEYALLSTGQKSQFTVEQRFLGDTDKNGSVDSVDASSILAYYAYVATGGSQSIEDFINNSEVEESADWCKAYTEVIKEFEDEFDTESSYYLINVDDNEVPELFMVNSIMQFGRLYTYHNDTAKFLFESHGRNYWLHPNSCLGNGKIWAISSGGSTCWTYSCFLLSNGEFNLVEEVDFDCFDDYVVNMNNVSQEEFYRLNDKYSAYLSQGNSAEKTYSFNEILKYLSTISTESEAPTEPPAENDAEWRNAYLEVVNMENGYDLFSKYALIYIDKDDIPELYIDCGSRSDTGRIFSFYDGELIENSSFNDGYSLEYYVEKTGKLCGRIIPIGGIHKIYQEYHNGVFEDIIRSSCIGYEKWQGKINNVEVTEQEYNAQIAFVDESMNATPLVVNEYREIVHEIIGSNTLSMTGKVITKEDVIDIKYRPFEDDDILGKIRNGSTVYIIGEIGELYMIEYGTDIGYVLKEYISVE